MHVRWDLDSPGLNKDLLLYKNELRTLVPDDALCIVGNDISHFVFFYYIDKKGWGFDSDKLSSGQMLEMIRKGAAYMYSDSRAIDGREDISPFFDKLIFEKGSIRVYSLKH